MEDDLAQEVAELVAECGVGVGRVVDAAFGRVGGERLDGLDDLVRLLERVPGERVVGLLRVPRASARSPQPLHQLDETGELPGDRRVAGVDVERGQVIGLDHAVEVDQGHVVHELVGEAQPLEHRDRRLG